MWGLVLLMALSAAQDPIRIGVMTLLIARPRPMHNLLAYWLGLMATGCGAALVALFLLHDFLLPIGRVASSVAASPVFAPAQIALGVLTLSIAAMITVRCSLRKPAQAAMPGGDSSPLVLQPKKPTIFSPLWWSCRVEGMLECRSLRMAFVAGLCTSTQVIEWGAAMIAIIASGAGTGKQVGATLVFILVAYAITEVPLVSCLVAPTKTQAVVMLLHDWLRAHRRSIFIFMLCLVGAITVMNGVGRI
jgi:Sap, sulfolipid-1-addressing protein